MVDKNKIRGSLLGLAVGDALGTTLEFRVPGTFQKIADMVGGGPFHLNPGEWTDDTSMALCLAESLIEVGGFDPVDQLKRYMLWFREGHLSSNGDVFDVGMTVTRALRLFSLTQKPYCGPTDPDTAGNGSLMRLAPVPLYFAENPKEAIERSGESSWCRERRFQRPTTGEILFASCGILGNKSPSTKNCGNCQWVFLAETAATNCWNWLRRKVLGSRALGIRA